MNTSLTMAAQKLEMNLCEIREIRQLNLVIREYLETCLHDGDQSGEVRYFDTLIQVSDLTDETAITITRCDDGELYSYSLEAVRRGIPQCRYDFSDGFFNSTDCDEYVGSVLWELHTLLEKEGFIKLSKSVQK